MNTFDLSKRVLLVLGLIYCKAIFSDSNIILDRVNTARVAMCQREIEKQIFHNKIFSYGISGIALTALSYYTYKNFIIARGKIEQIKPLDPMAYIYPNLVKNGPTIDKICDEYRNGKLSAGQLSFFQKLFNKVMMISSFSPFLSLLPSLYKPFKTLDVVLIIREKTKIPFIFASLKENAAALDNQSPMLQDGLVDIAAASENMTELDIEHKVKQTVSLFNDLICDLEKVLAFMGYKANQFNIENKIYERDKVNKLINELQGHIDFSLVKFDNILTQIYKEKNNLLAEVVEFQRVFFQIVERLP